MTETATRWVDGQMLGFDLETTGTGPDALPVSLALVSFVAGEPVGEISRLVNPGIPIPAESRAIHGITDEMVRAEGTDLDEALDIMIWRIQLAGREGVPLVGMNVRFDLTIVDRMAEQRLGKGLRELGWHGPLLDALVLDRQVDRYRRGHRKLVDLCRHYGVVHAGAHDALADTVATGRVTAAIARKYPEIGDASLMDLTRSQVGWYREWFDSYNAYRQQRNEPPMPEEERDWPLPRRTPIAA